MSGSSPIIATDPNASASSYGQILKSSSVIGGAKGINYLVSLVRTKIVAVLLGPAGVGLVGIYLSITAVLSTFAGLGIGSSGVRDIAYASGSGDESRMAATVKALRRACWVTGIIGWILSVALAWPISLLVLNSYEHGWALAVLGITILFGTISAGQTALLQGLRRIGDLARIQVISMLLTTVISVALYAWLREEGIVPVLVATAALNLWVSWHFARRIKPPAVEQSWKETLERSKGLVGLGLAFMWSGLITALGAFLIRALIVRELGLDANGIYQAAWGISGMFAGFILGAMGTDFYPRLTAVSTDHEQVNRLVNEQTEIGVLLALPGLLGTLAFAPWLMHLFYSERFLVGAELLPWFVLGIFGQVISWPLGYVLLAKGARRWYVISETLANLLKIGTSVCLLFVWQLVGAAIAYPVLYLFYTGGMFFIIRHLTGFRCSRSLSLLLCLAGGLISMGFASSKLLPEIPALLVGGLLTAVASVFSLRGLIRRIGQGHRFIRAVLRVPGARFFLG